MPRVCKFLLGSLFESKCHIFAIKNQYTSYSIKVAWILKFQILIVFCHKSSGFSLNSRFSFIVISEFAHPWCMLNFRCNKAKIKEILYKQIVRVSNCFKSGLVWVWLGLVGFSLGLVRFGHVCPGLDGLKKFY